VLFQKLFKSFQTRSQIKSEQTSLKPLPLSVSQQAPLQESSSSPSWINKATEQIKTDEGLVLSAYQDHLGYWTIGYGRLIDRARGGGITEEEAALLLKNDVDTRLLKLRQSVDFFDSLDDVRKSVLLNMSFQLGLAGLLKFRSTLSYVKTGDYYNASKGMLESLWATQTPARAKRLAAQMRTGQW
jgi:lysozyme